MYKTTDCQVCKCSDFGDSLYGLRPWSAGPVIPTYNFWIGPLGPRVSHSGHQRYCPPHHNARGIEEMQRQTTAEWSLVSVVSARSFAETLNTSRLVNWPRHGAILTPTNAFLRPVYKYKFLLNAQMATHTTLLQDRCQKGVGGRRPRGPEGVWTGVESFHLPIKLFYILSLNCRFWCVLSRILMLKPTRGLNR